MNFNKSSCITFVLKCANTPKPKRYPGGKNVLIPPGCMLLVLLPLHEKMIEDKS